jgi:oligopeptide transport system substrate-binding protein
MTGRLEAYPTAMNLLAIRKAFPYLALAVLGGAVVYATSFGTLPRADLTFNNLTEIKTVDPPKATGEPEGRVIEGLYEGLLRRMPVPDAPPPTNRTNTPYKPQLATADDMQISEDGRTYTFHIRESAKWSDGTPVTAHDYAWSWLRMLHPETESEYSYQLWYIVGAEDYTTAKLEVDKPVEVELADRANRLQTFPRGTIVRGVLKKIDKPEGKDEKAARDATVYEVEVDGKLRSFCRKPPSNDSTAMLQILPDFEATVGLKVEDDHKLVVTLKNRTPYFADLVAFYPLYPTNRACVEKYGSPAFTRPENLVTNGPFKLQFRRIRDRVRMAKNPHYWNADNVQLNTVDAMAISSDIAALNMYETGQIDWTVNVPPVIIPDLRPRDDFYTAPILTVYFYRINCTRKPLDDKRVRRALNLAMDKQKICERVLRAGEEPATNLVPRGVTGYDRPMGGTFDPETARTLLAEAGFPEGHNFPKIEILYNTHETHQALAEVVQDDWRQNLGISVELRGLEWGTYQNAQTKLEYQVCRAGWNADYDDPNSFIDMFVTDGGNNKTGWSNAEYDRLVEAAAQESDPAQRMAKMRQAEEILIDELPILPIAFYMSKELVRPYVKGHSLNSLKLHPLHLMRIERGANDRGTSFQPVRAR